MVSVPLMAKKENALAVNLDMPSFYLYGDQEETKRNTVCIAELKHALVFLIPF